MSFGPHGPRKPKYDEHSHWATFKTTSLIVLASCVTFAIIRLFAREPPKTMTKEWQEMSNEYLKVISAPAELSWKLTDTRDRDKDRRPSPVFHTRATKAPVWFRARQAWTSTRPRTNRLLDFIVSRPFRAEACICLRLGQKPRTLSQSWSPWSVHQRKSRNLFYVCVNHQSHMLC